MKKSGMPRLAVLLVALAFLLPLLAAQATRTPSIWTWENYQGTSQWSVRVSEDDTGCGGSVSSTTLPVSLQHDFM